MQSGWLQVATSEHYQVLPVARPIATHLVPPPTVERPVRPVLATSCDLLRPSPATTRYQLRPASATSCDHPRPSLDHLRPGRARVCMGKPVLITARSLHTGVSFILDQTHISSSNAATPISSLRSSFVCTVTAASTAAHLSPRAISLSTMCCLSFGALNGPK